MNEGISPHTLEFYSTQLMACPYLPGRSERKLLTELDPTADAQLTYDTLARYGFRRSHTWAYRTACPDCNACVPVRVVADHFRPTRSMRRCLGQHAHWTADPRPPAATDEQFEVFSRYVQKRHGDGERLVAGLMVDRVRDGLSAVYSFFEPDMSGSGPGTYMILWLIAEARRRGLRNAYLGYWVANCRKMDYKIRFRPLEALGSGGWRTLDPPDWHPTKEQE